MQPFSFVGGAVSWRVCAFTKLCLNEVVMKRDMRNVVLLHVWMTKLSKFDEGKHQKKTYHKTCRLLEAMLKSVHLNSRWSYDKIVRFILITFKSCK